MRYVNFDRIEALIPSDWHIRAHSVNEALRCARDGAERARIIDLNRPLWREAGRYLAAIMDSKCWYCETRDERSDMPVDHFRPKGAVAGEEHDGYWWLAFVLENYRFSCTYCNSRRVDTSGGTSGGKQHHFPIAPTSTRAQGPDDSLDSEIPMLLDPANSRDVSLLLFDETGLPSLNEVVSTDPLDAERVSVSIDLYHWKHRPVATNRRLAFKKVATMCSEADRLLSEYERTGDDRLAAERQRLLRALNCMVDRAHEHSAAALCALRGLRTASRSASEALVLP